MNLFKDAPYKLFPGKKHREYFHDDATNFLLGVLYGPDAMLAGMLHDWADETFIERGGKLYLRPQKVKPKGKNINTRTAKRLLKTSRR